MDTLLHGVDTWQEGDNDSALHAEAKEHLATHLRWADYTAYIEYPIPRIRSQSIRSFRWIDDDIQLAENEYYSFNQGIIPLPEVLTRRGIPLSFIFDVAVEDSRGVLGVFEIRVSHPVSEAKKRFMKWQCIPMQEIDARWLMDNWPKKTPSLQLVDGRVLAPHQFFNLAH